MKVDITKHNFELHQVPEKSWREHSKEWYASFKDECPACGAKAEFEDE